LILNNDEEYTFKYKFKWYDCIFKQNTPLKKLNIEICNKCKGNGIIDGGSVTVKDMNCPECKGTGYSKTGYLQINTL